jgi:hypothetical protein
MFEFRIPPAAFFLCIALCLGAFAVGATLGGWIAVGALAVTDRGWVGLGLVPRTFWVFPELPAWFDATQAKVGQICCLTLALVLGVTGLRLAQRVWQYLVVKRFRWMTDQEVDEFWRRDPGF